MTTLARSQPGANVSTALQAQLAQFRATHPVKQLSANGQSWEYLASGRGTETLLILPGLLGIGEMSFQPIEAFEHRFCVLAPSYPFGLASMAQMVDGIAAVLDSEGVRQAHILGGSYGGMVAQWFVRRYPERAARLILSHTGGPKPKRAAQNRRFLSLMRLLPMGLLQRMLRASTRRALRDAPEHIPFWEAYSDEMIARLTKADLVSRFQLAVDFDASANFTAGDLSQWPGRILILEGDNDPVAGAEARAALKALHPQARVHTFRGSGHVASIARLDEYISVVHDFLTEV